jgi:hypothetical protein
LVWLAMSAIRCATSPILPTAADSEPMVDSALRPVATAFCVVALASEA